MNFECAVVLSASAEFGSAHKSEQANGRCSRKKRLCLMVVLQFSPDALTFHLLAWGKLPSPTRHSKAPGGLLRGNTEIQPVAGHVLPSLAVIPFVLPRFNKSSIVENRCRGFRSIPDTTCFQGVHCALYRNEGTRIYFPPIRRTTAHNSHPKV